MCKQYKTVLYKIKVFKSKQLSFGERRKKRTEVDRTEQKKTEEDILRTDQEDYDECVFHINFLIN
jgi:hypothetical protein